ncbi:MAG TPA: OB-fold nucleic acid binding domain-containing protein, partial [Fibrobacteria bacterium]|nr:OB-fold nucleic acid binding domain-containing protein [Fibrobacteria bacterium]
HEVAGLSFKEADRIRKMMNSQHEGRPDPEFWARTRAAFIAGCRRNPHPEPFTETQAAELWTRVASFSGFSFCKSHSASYAELSFQCSRLKAHYPAQFLSAVISNHHGFYTRGVYLDEARRRGIRILPLSVNHSRLKYRGEGRWIRPGLLPVRDCREAAMRVLVDEREANGPYRDLVDLLQRVPLHRREAENLILAGACGEWGLTQPQLLYLLDAAYPHIHRDQGDLLIGAEGSVAEAASRVPFLAEYPLMQRCLGELRMLGYVLSANMLDVVRMHPAARDAVRADRLGDHAGRRVKVVGMPVTDRIHPVARDGRYMKFLTLGDDTGYLDVILWPDALERWNDTLQGQVPFSGNLVEVHGKVSEDAGTFSLEADRVRVIEWLPNQVDFVLASRRLQEGLRNYPAHGRDEDAGSLAA